MKWLKYLLLGLATLLGVATVGAIVTLATIDPNHYKPEIEQAVHQQTGRTLELKGDLSVSYFPWLGFKLGEAKLGNAPGFGAGPFIQVQEAALRVALLPLIQGRVEAETLLLKGLTLDLQVDKAGKPNWQDLVAEHSVPPPQVPSTPAPILDQGPKPLNLSLNGVQIENASVHWRNEQTGSAFTLFLITLTTGSIAPGQPTEFQVHIKAQNKAPLMEARFELKGRLDLSSTEYFWLRDLTLVVKVQGEGLPAKTVETHLNGVAEVDLRTQWLTVTPLTLEIHGTTADGMTAKARLTSQASFNLVTERFWLDNAELDLGAAGGPLPGKALKATLKTDVEADLKTETLSVDSLRLEALGITAIAGIKASGLFSTPYVHGILRVQPFSPREVLKALGQPAPKGISADALKKLALELAFRATPEAVNLPKLDVGLDETLFRGKLSVQDLSRPKVVFTVSLNDIDLDRYFPKSTEPTPKRQEHEGLDLPTETLRRLDVSGLLEANSLKASGVEVKRVHVTLYANDGLLQLRPFFLDVYQGHLRGTFSLDVRGATPRFTGNVKVKGLQLGEALKKKPGSEGWPFLTGASDLEIQVSTQGDTPERLLRDLDGQLQIRLERGVLYDNDLAEQITRLAAFLQGRTSAPSGQAPLIRLLTATAEIKEGVIYNDDLNLFTPIVELRGQGSVNLPEGRMNYALYPVLKGRLSLAPITLQGPFSDLHTTWDVTGSARYSRPN